MNNSRRSLRRKFNRAATTIGTAAAITVASIAGGEKEANAEQAPPAPAVTAPAKTAPIQPPQFKVSPAELKQLVDQYGIASPVHPIEGPVGDIALLYAGTTAGTKGTKVAHDLDSIMAKVVPTNQRMHNNAIDQAITAQGNDTGLLYKLGVALNIVDGHYQLGGSSTIFGFGGIQFGGTEDHRHTTGKLFGLKGIPNGTSFSVIPDPHAKGDYMRIELAGIAREIGTELDSPLTDDQARILAMANFMHKGEGTLDPSRTVVLRAKSADWEQTAVAPKLGIGPGAGDVIVDIMYVCPDTVAKNPNACLGANGLPLKHITRNHQYIDLPGPYRLVHLKIEGCHKAGPEGLAGIVRVPHILYGKVAAPSPVPVEEEIDAGLPDAPDAGQPDPTPAAGTIEPPQPDAGVPDADAGVPDAAQPDADPDLEAAVQDAAPEEHSSFVVGVEATTLYNNLVYRDNHGIGELVSLVFGGSPASAPRLVLRGRLGVGFYGSDHIDGLDEGHGAPNEGGNPGGSTGGSDNIDLDAPSPTAHYGYDVTDRDISGYGLDIGLDLLGRAGDHVIIGGGLGAQIVFLPYTDSILEQTLGADGTVYSSNSYDDDGMMVRPMGMARFYLSFLPTDHLSIDLNATAGTDFNGLYVVGGGLGLSYHWGGSEE